MEKFDAPKELIDDLNKSETVEILPVNWPVIVWFCQVSDLMRYRMDGQCLGLDLMQIKVEAEMSEREYTPAHFNGLRVMSKTSASIMNRA